MGPLSARMVSSGEGKMQQRSVNYAKKLLGDGYDYSGFEIVSAVYDNLYEGFDLENDKKFIDKFHRGFSDRPSAKEALPTRTVPDYSTDAILCALVDNIDENMLSLIRYAHRISMAADSMIGVMLDEYIHERLRPMGWACCWGNSLQGIDFCSSDGILLHVRNKSNTEVSSNDRNRIKNKVYKWFRLNAYTGKTKWEELNRIVGKEGLFSEDGFRDFAYNVTKKNPGCLYTGEDDIASFASLIEEFRK